MTIDVPTGRGPAHDTGTGQIETTLPGLGPDPAQPPYASWGRRVFAYLLDAAVVSAVTFLAVGPVGVPSILPGISVPSSDDPGVTVTDSGWLVATAIAFALLQAYAGWTPGKRTVGIVVVRDETGRPAGLLATVLRWVAHVLDAILLIGFLRPLWNAQRKTFADSLLHTVVVLSADAPSPHPWVAALRARWGTRGPDGAPGRRGRRASTVVTASATLVCVTASAFALTPATIVGGDVWQSECTPLVEPGASTAPLRFEHVGIVSWTVPVTETRWGVTRTAAPTGAPAFAPADADGLEATYVVTPAPGSPTGVPVDAELVLTLSTWDGDLVLERSSGVRVTPEPDGSVTYDLLSGSPDGGDLETVRVAASTVAALEPAWRWDASLRIDGTTVASCGGRGPS